MQWKIPLSDVTLGEEEVEAATRTLRSGWLTQGPQVEEFERRFAAALGARHAVAVSSGTSALHLAYLAAGLGPGDEFILPGLTFVATLHAGLYLGARPVLVDCASPADLTLSVEDVARKITPRTRLIVSMPYGGFCPDMPALEALARERGIPLVEDACHAPLAELDGRKIGRFGLAGCFSFFSNKNLSCGEGGCLVTDDAELAARVARLRSHGMDRPSWDRHRGHAADYDVLERGFNYRLDELRAAVLNCQLDKLPQANARRERAWRGLAEALTALGIEGLEIPFHGTARGRSACHLFAVLLPPGRDRGAFREALAAAGIQTSVHYPPLTAFTATADCWPEGPPRLPVLDALAPRLVTLPMGPHLDEQGVALVAGAVERALA